MTKKVALFFLIIFIMLCSFQVYVYADDAEEYLEEWGKTKSDKEIILKYCEIVRTINNTKDSSSDHKEAVEAEKHLKSYMNQKLKKYTVEQLAKLHQEIYNDETIKKYKLDNNGNTLNNLALDKIKGRNTSEIVDFFNEIANDKEKQKEFSMSTLASLRDIVQENGSLQENQDVYSDINDILRNTERENAQNVQENELIDPTLNPTIYKTNEKIIKSTKIAGIVAPILVFIRNIGVIVSVIVLMIIGIKYMLGSVEERAEYKKTLFPYIIGAFILFSGSTIPDILYNFFVKSK